MTTAARPPLSAAFAVEDAPDRLRELIDGLPIGIYRSAPDGQILAANPAAARILGYSTPAELAQVSAFDLYADATERARWKEQMDREGTVHSFDFRILRPDGKTAWVRDFARAVKGPDGNVQYYEGTLEDITERKRIRAALQESEEQSRSIFETAPIGMTIVSPEGRFMNVNRALCEMLGYSAAELTALTIDDISPPEDQARDKEVWDRLIRSDRVLYERDRRYVSKSGKVLWVHITGKAFRDQGSKALYTLNMVENIDEQRRAQAALAEANDKLKRSLADLTERTRRVMLLTEMTDLLQSCRTVEEAYAVLRTRLPEFFAAESGAVYLQSSSRRLLEAVATWGVHEKEGVFDPEDCWAMRRGRHHFVRRGGPFCPHFEALQPAWSICIPMTAQGEALGVLTLAQSARQAAEQPAYPEERDGDAERLFASTVAEHIALALANLRLRETLKSQSIRDPLTGLFNRRYMEETLERELRRADRRKASVGVVMFDIDHFKQFNDTNGHLAGDALLKALGEFLQANFRGEDIVCRYGGEEFVLILPEAAADATVRRADVLREKVKVLHVPYRGSLLGGVTISLGVAAFPMHGENVDALLRAADSALYEAKTAGRDCVVCQAPS